MRKVLLILVPGVESMEFSPFLDIFGWNEMLGSKDLHLEICSLEERISASWNLKLQSELNIKDIELSEYSAVILPGGFGKYHYFETIKNKDFQSLIAGALEQQLYIIGICTGSILLASTGYFEGKRMTTYLYENGRYSKQLAGYKVNFQNSIFCKDERVWTSSSPATAIPLAFDLLEELTSHQNRKYIETIMGF